MTADTKRLVDLRERVKKATGPDRELDCDLFVAAADSPFVSYYPECVLAAQAGFTARLEIAQIPAYTASIDAALALVERMLPGSGVASLREPSRYRELSKLGTVVSVPLAILAALLRALAEAAPGQEGGSSKWGASFPTSCCVAYEDCVNDGVCHDPERCGVAGPAIADDDEDSDSGQEAGK